MTKMQMQTDLNTKSLIGGFTDMPLQELELIIKELNALAIRKRFAELMNRLGLIIAAR